MHLCIFHFKHCRCSFLIPWFFCPFVRYPFSGSGWLIIGDSHPTELAQHAVEDLRQFFADPIVRDWTIPLLLHHLAIVFQRAERLEVEVVVLLDELHRRFGSESDKVPGVEAVLM